MLRFLIKLSLLTVLSSLLYALAGRFIPAQWIYKGFIWVPVLIAAVTALLHRGLLERKNDGKKFVRYYMGSTGLKLFLYLSIIIVMALVDKTSAVSFAMSFFYFYLCFTIFEVSESYQSFGQNKVSG